MSTLKDKYFERVLETLVDHNDCHNAPFSNEKLYQAVSKVMSEMEEEERNSNNVTMNTLCQYPVTNNIQIKNAKVPNKKQITSDILEEKIKGFKGLTLHSIINNSTYDNSDKDDAERDPKIDQLISNHTGDRKKIKITDTDTTNINFSQKLLINQTIPVIIPPTDPPIVDGVAASRGSLHARQTIASEDIVTDAARTDACVFQDPAVVNRKDTDRTIPQDGNTSRNPFRLNSSVRIGGEPSVFPPKTGIQDIISPSGPIGYVEVRNAQPFHTSINGNSVKNRDPVLTLSKLIVRKLSDNSIANLY